MEEVIEEYFLALEQSGCDPTIFRRFMVALSAFEITSMADIRDVTVCGRSVLLEYAYYLHAALGKLSMYQLLFVASTYNFHEGGYPDLLADIISDGLRDGQNVSSLIELAKRTMRYMYFPFEDALIPYASDELLGEVLEYVLGELIDAGLGTVSGVMMLFITKDEDHTNRVLDILSKIDNEYEYIVANELLNGHDRIVVDRMLTHSNIYKLMKICKELYDGEELIRCKYIVDKWWSSN